MTVEELSGELIILNTTLEKALKLLEVDGAVEREAHKYLRTPIAATRPSRMERVTQHRLDELAQIKDMWGTPVA